jgi:hypothetical protein
MEEGDTSSLCQACIGRARTFQCRRELCRPRLADASTSPRPLLHQNQLPNPRLVSLATGNGHSTPTTKKRDYKKRGKASHGHKHFDEQNIDNETLNKDMPFYLVQDLNNLDMQEFEIAFDYWMNHFKLSYATTELTAYDEGIYPDE